MQQACASPCLNAVSKGGCGGLTCCLKLPSSLVLRALCGPAVAESLQCLVSAPFRMAKWRQGESSEAGLAEFSGLRVVRCCRKNSRRIPLQGVASCCSQHRFRHVMCRVLHHRGRAHVPVGDDRFRAGRDRGDTVLARRSASRRDSSPPARGASASSK